MNLMQMREEKKKQEQQNPPLQQPQKPSSEDLIARQMEEIQKLREELKRKDEEASKKDEQHRREMQEQTEKNTQLLSEKQELSSLVQEQKDLIAVQSEQIVRQNKSGSPQKGQDPKPPASPKTTSLSDVAAELKEANEYMVKIWIKEFPKISPEKIRELADQTMAQGGVLQMNYVDDEPAYGSMSLNDYRAYRYLGELQAAMMEVYKQIFIKERKEANANILAAPERFKAAMERLDPCWEEKQRKLKVLVKIPKWQFWRYGERKAAEEEWGNARDAFFKEVKVLEELGLRTMGTIILDKDFYQLQEEAEKHLAWLEQDANTERKKTRPDLPGKPNEAAEKAATKKLKAMFAQIQPEKRTVTAQNLMDTIKGIDGTGPAHYIACSKLRELVRKI